MPSYDFFAKDFLRGIMRNIWIFLTLSAAVCLSSDKVSFDRVLVGIFFVDCVGNILPILSCNVVMMDMYVAQCVLSLFNRLKSLLMCIF